MKMRRKSGIVATCAAAAAGMVLAPAPARASVYLSENFSTYADGPLVGQNGWAQTGTASTPTLNISGGKVSIPSLAFSSGDGQDAYKALSTAPTAPTTLFEALTLNITAASTNPAFITAINEGATGTGFNDFRLTAKDNGGGTYVLGARVNGQAGYPYGYGTTGLAYGTQHLIVVEADMIGTGATNGNDVVKIYVDPASSDLSTVTPYATSGFTTGTVADPLSEASLVMSQFTNATTGQDGLTIGSIVIANTAAEAVPEPASLGLLSFAGAMFLRRRRTAM